MELVRSYNVLSSANKLRETLSPIFSKKHLKSVDKFQLHSLFNQVNQEHYSGESYIKSLLVDHFIKEDAIAAFEIRTNNSRLDFLRINGATISYEIKSEVDNLGKLKYQAEDYLRLFEYNYVVIGMNHLSEVRDILPVNYGIIIVKNGSLVTKRKARKNTRIDPCYQLKLFNKSELLSSFDDDDDLVIIQNSYSSKQINFLFKQMLKKRYGRRWDYFVRNKKQVLQIDYQYFYNHNIDPSIIYGR